LGNFVTRVVTCHCFHRRMSEMHSKGTSELQLYYWDYLKLGKPRKRTECLKTIEMSKYAGGQLHCRSGDGIIIKNIGQD